MPSRHWSGTSHSRRGDRGWWWTDTGRAGVSQLGSRRTGPYMYNGKRGQVDKSAGVSDPPPPGGSCEYNINMLRQP
jgi:hypothetical protein